MSRRSVLILSNAPPPVDGAFTMFNGLRCWGLAQGLISNDDRIDVVLAYDEIYAKEDQKKEPFYHQKVLICTWNKNNLESLINSCDSIIVNYSLGFLPLQVINLIQPHQQLILDCCAPVFFEVSAYLHQRSDFHIADFDRCLSDWNPVLKKGDLFLCAHEVQKTYYLGVLSALGRINPSTYAQDLISIVPYGIYRDPAIAKRTPISELVKDQPCLKVLWFGGYYPWFKKSINSLLRAIDFINTKVPVKLVIVGAKNPSVDHPTFLKHVKDLEDHIKEQNFDRFIIKCDWVDYHERADWYLDCDLIVMLNENSLENALSWRTRLMDFIWADVAIATNGGDLISEELIKCGAALRIQESNMASELFEALTNRDLLDRLKKNLLSVRPKFYWDVITQELTKKIIQNHRAIDLQERRKAQQEKTLKASLQGVFTKAKKIPNSIRKHGISYTLKKISKVLFEYNDN